MLAIDAAPVAIAGGFVVGVVVGGFAVIHVTRWLLEYLRDERSRRE